MATTQMNFARANLNKILFLPLFGAGWLLAWIIPRNTGRWVFGSGIGVGEGALPISQEIQARFPSHHVRWIVSTEAEVRFAAQQGLRAIRRSSFRAFWYTIRAGHIVVTHGLGDVSRFGVFRAEITHLIHGAPIKKLHLDSPVTTSMRGPKIIQQLLKKMYRLGGSQFTLLIAGSETAAERLRTAYNLLPGKVRVLGDARDDIIYSQFHDPGSAKKARETVAESLGLKLLDDPLASDNRFTTRSRLLLFAPTWRDGEFDPLAPTGQAVQKLHQLLEQIDGYLLVRSHPLGSGDYSGVLNDRVRLWDSRIVRDINPLLAAFDGLITDYSSAAIDFSILERPIVWFAPDVLEYSQSRGLYEPYGLTTQGRFVESWAEVIDQIGQLDDHSSHEYAKAVRTTQILKARFHPFADGKSAHRAVDAIMSLSVSDDQRVPTGAVFFESFYGKQISCNPAAIDLEIAISYPNIPRFWSVISDEMSVPEGAIKVVVGSPDWFAARRRAHLLIVNDWLRFRFQKSSHQSVLQTWHGTMLKHLALTRPKVSLRTKFAILNERKKWNLLLSQNPHSTAIFRKSYAFRGEILELGYPRDDVLAHSVESDASRIRARTEAKRLLNISVEKNVLLYAPTWREHSENMVDEIDIQQLASELGDKWVILVRAHTRSAMTESRDEPKNSVIDVSKHPEINDLILAADVLVTDYSSVMFDASIVRIPMAFFVPDIDQYREIDRGFTFDFPAVAPGPLCFTPAEILDFVKQFERPAGIKDWQAEFHAKYEHFRKMFTPHDDGGSSRRVVGELVRRGLLQIDRPRP